MYAMIPRLVMRCCVCQNTTTLLLRSYSNSSSERMMPFEDYRKLRKTMKQRALIWGIPFAFTGMTISSAVNVMLFPNIFEMAADDIQPILLTWGFTGGSDTSFAPLPFDTGIEDEQSRVINSMSNPHVAAACGRIGNLTYSVCPTMGHLMSGGMDPLLFAALTGMAAAGVGFFVGGTLHREIWKIVNKEKHRQLIQREEDFLRRIQKYRFAEFGSFQDDYYGDKVQTLSDYRQWVREQQKKKEMHKDFVAKEAAKNQS